MKKNNLLTSALVLSIGGLVAKILGALYRIPLTNIVGSYGMGLYQLVFPPYILFLTLAQAGVPVALSKLIAEKHQLGLENQGRKVFSMSFVFLLATGLASAVAMCLLANFIANAQGNGETATAFLVVAPALVFVPVTNVLKGYFQGNMNMTPCSVTTVVEQIVKLAVGLFCAVKFMPNVHKAVLGAVFAITVSEFCSMAIMSVVYLVHKKKPPPAQTFVAKGRFFHAVQATCGACRSRCAWWLRYANFPSHRFGDGGQFAFHTQRHRDVRLVDGPRQFNAWFAHCAVLRRCRFRPSRHHKNLPRRRQATTQRQLQRNFEVDHRHCATLRTWHDCPVQTHFAVALRQFATNGN